MWSQTREGGSHKGFGLGMISDLWACGLGVTATDTPNEFGRMSSGNGFGFFSAWNIEGFTAREVGQDPTYFSAQLCSHGPLLAMALMLAELRPRCGRAPRRHPHDQAGQGPRPCALPRAPRRRDHGRAQGQRHTLPSGGHRVVPQGEPPKLANSCTTHTNFLLGAFRSSDSP